MLLNVDEEDKSQCKRLDATSHGGKKYTLGMHSLERQTQIKKLLEQAKGMKNIPMDASVGKANYLSESGLCSLAVREQLETSARFARSRR